MGSNWVSVIWYCVRCGSKLNPMEDSTPAGAKKPREFLCSKEDCIHHDDPLRLHHPSSITTPSDDSYSLSWIE